MINITYPAVFLKKYKKLESSLKEEVEQKLKLFKDRKNHDILKVHKLHGKFSGCYSFSVNYRIRIVFRYISHYEAFILDIDNHDIYK